MRLFSFALLLASAAAAGSPPVLQFKAGGNQVQIEYNGTHLQVPQHCRSETCNDVVDRMAQIEERLGAMEKTLESHQATLDILTNTPAPTPAPTPHICTTDRHGCDRGEGGECYEDGEGYYCGCAEGFHQLVAHDPDAADPTHACARITNAPTVAPTPAPTPAECVPNGNFENGLTGWTKGAGCAFDGSPVTRCAGARFGAPNGVGTCYSGNAVDSHGGTAEQCTGSLTSDWFLVTHRYLSWKYGGFDSSHTVIEFQDGTEKVDRGLGCHRNSDCGDRWKDDAVDMSSYRGKLARVKLVDSDAESGQAWGMWDEFECHESSSGRVVK